ncbi:MAG TPA: ATP-binding protein, partial [Actinomycetales bacterium]
AESAAQLRTLLPVTVGGPLLLMLVLFPLALTMARRVDRAGEERAGLLRHAVEASALERRRIAGDLHDGVVQDLAGIGYALPAIVATLDDHPRLRGTRADLERVAGIVHQDLAALRSVITEIYPADLREGGLTPAAQQLAADARRAGVEVEVDVASELAGRGLPPDAAMLAYRVVREALRNVVRHARATSVQVTVRRGGRDSRDVVVRVVDDGVGFDGPVPRPTGHFGLRLLSDTIQDLSGTFEIRSAAGRGTEVEARFPIDWASR